MLNAIGTIGEEELKHAIEQYANYLRSPDVRVKKVVDEAASIERLATGLARELENFYETIGLIVETGKDTPEIHRLYFTYEEEPGCLEICKGLGGLSSMISRVRKEVILTFGSGDLKNPTGAVVAAFTRGSLAAQKNVSFENWRKFGIGTTATLLDPCQDLFIISSAPHTNALQARRTTPA